MVWPSMPVNYNTSDQDYIAAVWVGPLLFIIYIIYIYDLHNSSQILSFICFADDSNLFFTHRDPRTLILTQWIKNLKLIFIDYKYGRIWYQCKGNDMRIIITLIPNKKKIWSAEIANQKLLRRPSRNLTRTRLWKTQICDVILWATLSIADDVL